MDPALKFLFVRMVWDRTGWPQPAIVMARPFDLHYGPEPDYPFGRRGKAMAAAWDQLGTGMAGMLVQDGDVLIDPHDYMMMLGAIHSDPSAVHVAPAKIWPASKTDLRGWSWAHWKNGQAGQEIEYDPDFFCFNFTYLPRDLITLCAAKGLKSWRFPSVDQHVSRECRKAGVPVRVVKDCSPKHMHF